MMNLLSYIVAHMLAVGDLLVLLLLAGALLRACGKRGGHVFVNTATVAFAIVLLLPVGSWAIRPLESRFPTPVLPPTVDGILLLTGAINVSASVERRQPIFFPYAERITTAVTLARRFPNARIVIAGGRDDPDEPSEASVHRDLMVALGVDASRIEVEEHSHNTCENAAFSYRQIRPGSRERWLLVTSAFHLPRAVACFRHVGWDVIPYPAGYKSQDASGIGIAGNLQILRLALHEWVGLLGYYAMGRTDDVFPAPEPQSQSQDEAVRR